MKYIFGAISLFLFLVLSATSIEGFVFVYDCVNDTHLQVTLTIDGDVIQQDPFYCPYGCVENITEYGDDCAPTDYEIAYTGIFIIIIIFIAIFSTPYLIKRFRKKKKKRRGF